MFSLCIPWDSNTHSYGWRSPRWYTWEGPCSVLLKWMYTHLFFALSVNIPSNESFIINLKKLIIFKTLFETNLIAQIHAGCIPANYCAMKRYIFVKNKGSYFSISCQRNREVKFSIRFLLTPKCLKFLKIYITQQTSVWTNLTKKLRHNIFW